MRLFLACFWTLSCLSMAVAQTETLTVDLIRPAKIAVGDVIRVNHLLEIEALAAVKVGGIDQKIPMGEMGQLTYELRYLELDPEGLPKAISIHFERAASRKPTGRSVLGFQDGTFTARKVEDHWQLDASLLTQTDQKAVLETVEEELSRYTSFIGLFPEKGVIAGASWPLDPAKLAQLEKALSFDPSLTFDLDHTQLTARVTALETDQLSLRVLGKLYLKSKDPHTNLQIIMDADFEKTARRSSFRFIRERGQGLLSGELSRISPNPSEKPTVAQIKGRYRIELDSETPADHHAFIATNKELAASLYAATNLDAIVLQINEQTQAFFQSLSSQLPGDTGAKLAEVAATNYSYTELKQALLHSLADLQYNETGRKGLAWVQGPMGQKFKQAETQMMQDKELEKTMQAYLETLDQESEAFKNRSTSIEHIIRDSGLIDLSSDMSAYQILTTTHIAQNLTKSILVPPDQEDAFINDLRKKQSQNLTETVYTLYVFMLRDLSDEDLKAYADFYASPEGNWFASAQNKARLDLLEYWYQLIQKQLS